MARRSLAITLRILRCITSWSNQFMMDFFPPNHDEMAFVVVAIQCSLRLLWITGTKCLMDHLVHEQSNLWPGRFVILKWVAIFGGWSFQVVRMRFEWNLCLNIQCLDTSDKEGMLSITTIWRKLLHDQGPLTPRHTLESDLQTLSPNPPLSDSIVQEHFHDKAD